MANVEPRRDRVPGAWLVLAPITLGVALAMLRGLPDVAGPLGLLGHLLATALVFRIALLAAGRAAGALLAASLYAVGPAPLSAGGGLVLVGVALGFAALALALDPRPRPLAVALLLATAVALVPAALGLPLLIGLALGRVPGLAILGALAGAAIRLPGFDPAVAGGGFGLELAGIRGALPGLPPVAVLAVALAVALHPGPLGRRSGAWCAALCAFALPWGALLGGSSPSGAPAFVALALAGLGAELSRAVRAATGHDTFALAVEAVLVAACALLG